jgi:curved DNA-binding protein CbpA
MQGQLSERSLAELIAEITDCELSGAVRLHRDPMKVAVYFDQGKLIYASSNLRVHRLANFLQKYLRTNDGEESQLPDATNDDELTKLVMERGMITPVALEAIRRDQVSEILRVVMLWTDGGWAFDSRVRLAAAVRVQLELGRLLIEASRHLPADFIARRFRSNLGVFRTVAGNGREDLLPEEAFVLSRLGDAPTSLSEIQAISGLTEERTQRVLYGLALAGYITDSARCNVLSDQSRAARTRTPPPTAAAADSDDEKDGVERLFARLDATTDHYEVLDVSRMASADEIKNAYHKLAKQYHPDRFHQSELRSRLEAGFARIAQAYEHLSDQTLRAAYDQRRNTDSGKSISTQSKGELAFQKGQAALQAGRQTEALRFFSEATIHDPKKAKYHAEYGRALIAEPNSRRLAESELQTAIALEPGNSQYHVILAELYQQHGLWRRATSELERALAIDPSNANARALLAKLKK